MDRYEYRLGITRPLISPKTHYFRNTEEEWVARIDLEAEREHYRLWEPNTKITIERRPIGEWEEIE